MAGDFDESQELAPATARGVMAVIGDHAFVTAGEGDPAKRA
jgi:hypothetical protein